MCSNVKLFSRLALNQNLHDVHFVSIQGRTDDPSG